MALLYNADLNKWEEVDTPDWLEEENKATLAYVQESFKQGQKEKERFDKMKPGDVFWLK